MVGMISLSNVSAGRTIGCVASRCATIGHDRTERCLMNDPESSPGAFLGAELRRARVAAGFSSQEALAAKLGYDRTVIAKAETGERPPTPEVADALEAELFPEGPSGLVGRLARLARRADGPIPSWFENWLEAEAKADALKIWQPLIVPGLLQTAEYARALFIAAGEDAERADELVTARLARQTILDRPRPPHVVAVLDEAVLVRLIGAPTIMHDQLTHLVALAERPNMSIEVVPGSTGANAGLSGGFQLAWCDGAPEVLNMNGVEDVTAEGRSLVRRATIVFDRVRGDALPRTASRALILEAAEQWKTR
jgi:transcriptional regulator with XRE-family HTH domain